jgi:hypothetical protein
MVEYTIFDFIIDVGAPIAGAIVSGIFIFIIIKKILDDIVGDIDTLRGFTKMLITRVKTMNNDIIRIDSAVIDQIRMLDNDMIRLQKKLDTVLQMKENERKKTR